MKKLYLADLKDLSEKQVKEHIAKNYSEGESNSWSDEYEKERKNDEKTIAKKLEKYTVLVAYEHVGSWGCDSSSFFILQNKKTGKFGYFTGSHCSCYGFEGQFGLEEMPNKAFHKIEYFYLGGYDDDKDEHDKLVKSWIKKNIPEK